MNDASVSPFRGRAHAFLSPTEEIVEEAKNGRMFILVDDEDRENEGDLIIPAQMATRSAINFMATHGRGLICLAMTKERVDQLELPPMSPSNGTRHETAFTVSRPPTASMCQSEGVEAPLQEASVSEVTTIGLDIAKAVCGFRDHRAQHSGMMAITVPT
jgi:3,4-dihydroxy 2-butanone 4-phosphate synthase/GTP cyclohydrolase II